MLPAHGYILRYHTGEEAWYEYSIPEGDTVIGRGADCQIILNQQGISRHHARLSRSADQIWLTDLGSTNTTFLDGQALTPHARNPLPPGHPFTIETYTFIVSEPIPQGPGVIYTPVVEVIDNDYWLRYRLADGMWIDFPCPEGEVILGRSQDCDLLLDDDAVSRQHARINRTQDSFWLVDLGSTNGTQLEGEPLSPRRQVSLIPGQVFTIGNFSLYIVSRLDAGPIHEEIPPVRSLTAGTQYDRLIPGTPSMGVSGAEVVQTMVATDDLKLPSRLQALNLTVQDRLSIGREKDNNVILNYPLISRYHAVIERLGTRFRLQDLRSTNGVFINGKKVEGQTWLKERDEIRIGPYIFILAGNNLQAQVESGLHLEALGINQRVSSQVNLLQDINLYIKPMEFVALVGMSGSGKSTMLNALSGYRPASHGEVLVNGINLYTNYNLFRNDIGYVPQKDIVHAELTPRTALEYVARLRMPPDISPSERHAAVSEVLQNLDLTERKDVTISRLSGGQLKRVSIGVELLTKPRLFFLDEPTSGLDPGTEYDMMKLLRRLADQGRTVMLVTHATKNVMQCDKVIFLARGGHLAYFGPPEEALEYFDSHRTPRERREKQMEFDDIYRILNDESRGEPKGWDRRYRASPAYSTYTSRPDRQIPITPSQAMHAVDRLPKAESHTPQYPAVRKEKPASRTSSLRQFIILSQRNIKILFQDKVSLALMLALAPILGIMDFIWGSKLFDPVEGDAAKIITMWFMMALITVLVGALSSVREIVKEVDIYKRERAVNLKVMPYILSKVWVGVVLALYQAFVLLFFKVILTHPVIPSTEGYVWLYITLFLGTLCGYLVGLAISAGAPNQNAAMMLIIVVLVPQFLFAGALLPLDLIPGGEQISWIMPTRWTFEPFIRITKMGEEMVNDPCWQLEKSERLKLTEAEKENCPCMGKNIFSQCAGFPGILSPDFYDEEVKLVLNLPQPLEPPQPTAYPLPTPYPSPTALPTPTLFPSPTPLPTPQDPLLMADYNDDRLKQGQEYQDSTLRQFDQYRLDSQAQGALYSNDRTLQGDEYAALRQAQGDEYRSLMNTYGDERAKWQETREKAISSAEGILGTIYDNYGHTMKGAIVKRWVAMIFIMFILLIVIYFFQKRKDIV